MLLPDVNVLVAAFRDDAPHHRECRAWLEAVVTGDESYAVADIVLSGFARVVTHPRVFTLPTPVEEALSFANVVREQPHCVTVSPGPRHWGIFQELCHGAQARGNLIPDAFLAALAIESGCELVTLDRDFSRFAGLRWRTPG